MREKSASSKPIQHGAKENEGRDDNSSNVENFRKQGIRVECQINHQSRYADRPCTVRIWQMRSQKDKPPHDQYQNGKEQSCLPTRRFKNTDNHHQAKHNRRRRCQRQIKLEHRIVDRHIGKQRIAGGGKNQIQQRQGRSRRPPGQQNQHNRIASGKRQKLLGIEIIPIPRGKVGKPAERYNRKMKLHRATKPADSLLDITQRSAHPILQASSYPVLQPDSSIV